MSIPVEPETRQRHQVAQMVERARWAASVFADYGRGDVMRIAKEVASLGEATAREYADWAVAETGFGNADHKEIKNRMCSKGIYDYYKEQDFISHRVNENTGVVKIPRPAGVVFALTPSTNPVCSVFFKVLICLMTRNAVVISPHPAARECCSDAVHRISEVIENAGAPDGIVQIIEEPNLSVIQTVMKSDRIDLILATGGSPMVRAAYSSGNPALGVGPGNCPAYVDETADIGHAAECIANSKSFDQSILCTNESAVVAHQSIRDELVLAMQKQGCYFCTEEERERIENLLFPEDSFDISVIGKSAEWIAERARIRVPADTRVLVVLLDRIGDDYPLSREKLCPVLGFFTVPSRSAAVKACAAMTRKMGNGHSAAIHCKDSEMILRFGAGLNVLRTAVNAPCSMGASGFETNLAPTMTVGTGFYGRSSVGENVGPQHLVQWVRLAHNKNEIADMSRYSELNLPVEQPRNQLNGNTDYSFSSDYADATMATSPLTLIDSGQDLREAIHEIILEEIRSLQIVRE